MFRIRRSHTVEYYCSLDDKVEGSKFTVTCVDRGGNLWLGVVVQIYVQCGMYDCDIPACSKIFFVSTYVRM